MGTAHTPVKESSSGHFNMNDENVWSVAFILKFNHRKYMWTKNPDSRCSSDRECPHWRRSGESQANSWWAASCSIALQWRALTFFTLDIRVWDEHEDPSHKTPQGSVVDFSSYSGFVVKTYWSNIIKCFMFNHPHSVSSILTSETSPLGSENPKIWLA